MTLPLAPWSEVEASLPKSGRALLACYDDEKVTVFAAHDDAIGAYAVANGQFGGPAWRQDRITRFRTSIGRVMARSWQGQRAGKRSVLGISLKRTAFDSVLRQAVHWREFPEGLYAEPAQWRLAVRYSQVVMDWAPDCDPGGADLDRYCVRFGVRALALEGFCGDWVLAVHDLTALCETWRVGGEDPVTPVLRPYPVPEPALEPRLLWAPAEDG
jgi:hypothetical protein